MLTNKLTQADLYNGHKNGCLRCISTKASTDNRQPTQSLIKATLSLKFSGG